VKRPMICLITLTAVAVVILTSCAGGAYVSTEPPTPRVEERPQAPPGKTVTWIPGHWEWKRGEWHWRSGHWVKTKPGKTWVPGHWERKGPNKWKWVKGHWR
jgi:hypothetical protein